MDYYIKDYPGGSFDMCFCMSNCREKTCRRCLRGEHFLAWQAGAKEDDLYCCADFSKACSRYRPGEKGK